MKVPRTCPALSMTFGKEDISQKFFRLAGKRKHMGDVEQNQHVLGVLLLYLVLDHVKIISTLTGAKKMALIST